MEHEEKKNLLLRYRHLQASIEYYEDRLRELDADIAPPTSKLSGMPPVQAVSNPTQTMGERRAELTENLRLCRQMKEDIERGIERLGPGVSQRILIMRFVGRRRMSQDEAASKFPYGLRTFQRLEAEAIDAFEIEGSEDHEGNND